MDPAIVAYYDRLAPSYDADRFGNSYGRFLDRQERALLARYLPRQAARVLDLGCGTGRLTDRASHGCDASVESLKLASRKHPGKVLIAGDATALPLASASFDAAFSFHLFMHIDRAALQLAFAEVARVLRPGGVFVADIASALRRRLGRRRPPGWHGGTSLSRRELAALAAGAGLRMSDVSGVMVTPIHRVPPSLRRFGADLDRLVAGLVPEVGSYLVGRFVKEPA